MRSLGLKAYQALSRNVSDGDTRTRTPRPVGTIVWAVVHDDSELRAMLYLHERLMQSHGPSHLLLTSPQGTQLNVPEKLRFEWLPQDSPGAVQRFLDHWKPDICVWLAGALQPVLIAHAKQTGMPMLLLSARSDQLDQHRWRWVPGLARDTLACFDAITAADADAKKMLAKLVPREMRIDINPPLQVASPPPPVSEMQFEELSSMIAGRSVWLAARVQEDELSDVLQAHKLSVRLTHRLLLVLVCANFPVAMAARVKLAKSGWRCCFWDDGDIIDEATQIVLVEEPENMGLWLRAAPVTFMASSLKPGFGGCDPYEAAALGSAVIYGPNVRAHLSSYTRLASAGAARIVADAPSLARALAHLLAIDQAASMAHAAWRVISSGAQATDAVIEQMQDLLDEADRAPGS